MADHDAVVVGSGINSLACAALLARAGWSVAVLEREAELGGAIRTAELTEPGFLHDVFSAWHPLWVGGPAHAELGSELAERGLEYLNTEHPTATLFPDGESAFLTTNTDGNAIELERHASGDGEAWRQMIASVGAQAELVFGVLGTELWSPAGLNFAAKAYRRLGRRGLAEFGAEVVQSSRDWLTTSFASERAHGLLAPWVLHTGLGPDAAASGFMTRVIAFAIEAGGMPIPRGGGARLVDALVRLIEDHGGRCDTGQDVERVVVRSGRAVGVQLASGEAISADRAVVCNVTPTQLYSRLLEPDAVPADVAEAGRRFRFGRSEMQIHFALSEPARWEGDDRLGTTAIVHLTPGLDGVSRAVNEAERGLLPAEATIVVGQPLTIDESRVPPGKGLLWIQLQELPWQVKGDAAGELDPADGTWTETLRERYADRIQARLARQIGNLESSILRRVVLSPADLQAANVNLEHGDPYSGSLALDQNFLWRPFARQPGHRTPVDRLFHIGASTWPGPGLGAGSGTLVARALLQPPVPVRVAERLSAFLKPRQA
ncbi:MAG TPA: NAD(P)/FAD-dependent oxidoreductase [Gaiellaceae bacterium]|nr:NAD(P)/FAD-dependent oxidoreductase [Gaiellaceae bacterium]